MSLAFALPFPFADVLALGVYISGSPAKQRSMTSKSPEEVSIPRTAMITPTRQLGSLESKLAYQSLIRHLLVPVLSVYVPRRALLGQTHLRDERHPGLNRIWVEAQEELASACLSASKG